MPFVCVRPIIQTASVGDRKCTKKHKMILVQYLTDHEYSQPLTQKQLESPSLKDFKTIAEFLFKQLDPNFKFGDDFCEDIRRVFTSSPTSNDYQLMSGNSMSTGGGDYQAAMAQQGARMREWAQGI